MPVTISGIRSTSAILVPQGGTGNSELTSGSLLVGNGSNPVAFIPPGSEGQVLTVVNGEWSASNSQGGAGGISAVSSSGNLQGDGTSGSQLTLKDNISLTSVTASFSGNGSAITNITASNISNFASSVRTQLSGGNGIVYNPSTGIIEAVPQLGTSGATVSIDGTVMVFTGSAGFSVGNVVALSGTLVKADYSDNMKSNAIGVVSEVNGTTVTVKLAGEETVTSGSLITFVGTPAYVGPSGSVVQYGSIPSGKFATQIGYVSPNSGKIVIQPRVFGQLA